MILCITPNPAIDRTLILPSLVFGEVHRAQKIIVAAGGKGLNVARTVRTLGGEQLCMGFVGGHTGRLLADLAQNEGLNSYWTWMNAETRTCTILVPQEGDATVINEPGMSVSSKDWKRLQQDIHNHLSSARLVCISGSLPPDSGQADLQALLDVLVQARKQVWIDTGGATLLAALEQPELLIKVNAKEIGEVLGVEIRDRASTRLALSKLSKYSLRAAVITLGSHGAVLATRSGQWLATGPRVQVVSTVGSGDAFLGGLVSALAAGKPEPEALADGVAAGTANALSAGGGHFHLWEFEQIREHVQIETW